MRSSPATRLGDVLNGAYELNELLDAHDSHEVYRGTDRESGRPVRVKVLRPEFALQGEVVEGFLRAPLSLQKLEHASLPSVRVDSDDTGIPFVIEESVEGRPLSELIASFPQGMPLGLVTHLMLPLVEALALAHARGLIHGAIDPECVRWLGDPIAPLPKLLELGAGIAACDAAYQPPELTKYKAATRQADVFAVGVLMYRMLCGELPFGPGEARAVPLDEVAPQLPIGWVELTASCLERDPLRRCPDAAALLQRMHVCMSTRSAPPAQTRSPVPGVVTKSLRTSIPAHVGVARPIASGSDMTRPLAANETFLEARRGSEPAKDRNSRARELASKLSVKGQARGGESSKRPRTTASSRPTDPRPLTQGQVAAFALSEAQLDALRALRSKNEEDDDRWFVLFVMAFLMILLQLGLPLLYEPQMARAQALFGPRIQLAGAVFTVMVAIATVRLWAAHIKTNTLLMRVTSFSMFAVSACVGVVCATRFSNSGSMGSFAGAARAALPWGMSGLFFLFAFGGMLRGLRSLSHDVLYGMVLLLVASGSLWGSYRSVSSTVLAGKHVDVPSARVRPRLLDFADRKPQTSAEDEGQNAKAMEERHEVGANEADDLKGIDEIGATRMRNQAQLNQKLRAVSPE